MRKYNNHKAKWYRPLAPQFSQIEDSMQLDHFAAIEATLYLLHQNAPNADARKAYLLFAEYHLIGTKQCGEMEHILQNARLGLGYYRSQKAWQDALKLYCAPKYAAYRAFTVEQQDDGAISAFPAMDPIPYPFQDRLQECLVSEYIQIFQNDDAVSGKKSRRFLRLHELGGTARSADPGRRSTYYGGWNRQRRSLFRDPLAGGKSAVGTDDSASERTSAPCICRKKRADQPSSGRPEIT